MRNKMLQFNILLLMLTLSVCSGKHEKQGAFFDVTTNELQMAAHRADSVQFALDAQISAYCIDFRREYNRAKARIEKRKAREALESTIEVVRPDGSTYKQAQ